MKSTDTHYGTTAILIHWISALLVIVLIITGFRSGFAEDAATKTAALRIHVPVAIAVVALTIGRLVWWWKFDAKPAPVTGVPHWQETVGRWTHRALYLVLILMIASGMAMSILSGLPFALFGDAPLPNLSELPPRAGHGIGGRVLVLLILAHGGAALFHHLIQKDDTLRRMLPRRD